MSTKKERKIKRLRRLSIWPQIIETILVELAFLLIGLSVLSIGYISDVQDAILAIPKTSEVIVQELEKGWDKSSGELNPYAQEFAKGMIKYNSEVIAGISILDENNKVLVSYGDALSEEDTLLRMFSKEDFEQNGLFFDADSVFREKFELNYDIKGFVNWFFFSESMETKEFFEWASKSTRVESCWIMYKTKIEGFKVAIKKQKIRTSLESNTDAFIMLVFFICFIFIAIYENFKLITVIVSKYKFKKLIFTDPVTGGNNKEYFLYKTKKLIRRRRNYVMVYLRLEKFRNYNIAYGIKEGDNLMEDFYKCLCGLVTKRKELIVHLEKGDFALLLSFGNKELLDLRIDAIAKALNECRPRQHLKFVAGACKILSKKDDIQEKISNAAAAISKNEGRSQGVAWFDELMKEEQIWERRVEDDMERALEAGEFTVYLQPKYSTKKEELSAAEALVRWIHPDYGFVSPGKFIPIFEKNGFIVKLDDFMLTEISRLQAKWLSEGKKLVPISVNVSRAHFSRPDLAEHICGIVDEYKVPHEYIELELTESAFFDDKQVLLRTVKKLKNFGFKVSMDDFGAGYSSLNSLKELPLDIIKLDAQFFREVDDKKRADLIVGDTIRLAKKLGMQIVAEGIETREQVDFLAEQRCDLIQGFYFAKPLPVNDFEERAFSQGKKTEGNSAKNDKGTK